MPASTASKQCQQAKQTATNTKHKCIASINRNQGHIQNITTCRWGGEGGGGEKGGTTTTTTTTRSMNQNRDRLDGFIQNLEPTMEHLYSDRVRAMVRENFITINMKSGADADADNEAEDDITAPSLSNIHKLSSRWLLAAAPPLPMDVDVMEEAEAEENYKGGGGRSPPRSSSSSSSSRHGKETSAHANGNRNRNGTGNAKARRHHHRENGTGEEEDENDKDDSKAIQAISGGDDGAGVQGQQQQLVADGQVVDFRTLVLLMRIWVVQAFLEVLGPRK
ncbi:hypothetical protein F4778DRAFT_194395 [Xylariomycetidae sp. FL2044]|nr:hypothetical protein F4778DRAFT_194395 [Xylariomycetidae sp. FL2044]